MKKYIYKNSSGFTLAGLMVSVAITAIVALGAAYIVVSAQKTSNFGDVQNEIDRAHYLALQLSRNPAFILQQPGFEKTGTLYRCLQHSPPAGVDCAKLRAPASYVSTTDLKGLKSKVVSTIAFQPNCKVPQYCDSVTMTTSTNVLASANSGVASTDSFANRTATSIIPGFALVPQTGFNFNCVQSQGPITELNYGSSQALCQPLTGTLSTVTEPLANFGPTSAPTQTMSHNNCGANGFASIGSFQDQTSCMIPVATPPSPPTTAPSSPPTTIASGGSGGGSTTTTVPSGGSSTTTTMPSSGGGGSSNRCDPSKAPNCATYCYIGASCKYKLICESGVWVCESFGK